MKSIPTTHFLNLLSTRKWEACGALILTVTVSAATLHAADTPDQAWLDFLQARGEPALIGANAEHELALTAYRPIPAFQLDDIDQNKLRLGFDLFHERRLSVDNSIGCNSCHSGMFGGTDGRRISAGVKGAQGTLNAPTTFNAAFNFRQFWDGRALNLAEQALGPIENELEMGHDLDAVIGILGEDASYSAEFARIYPDGVTANNMADAIAYFQTVNFTRAGTPFIRHLLGEDGQLSEQALRGWQRFDEVGCASCHNGINLGGNSYQQLGAAVPYFGDFRKAGAADAGLQNRSGRDSDQYVFKVPTLHGVAETAPYFHDGSIPTLEEAIEEMGEHQLGRDLSREDIDDIAAYLRSLGGRPMGMGNQGMGRSMGMRQNNRDAGQGMQRGMGQGMQHGMGRGMHHGMGQGMGMNRGMRPETERDTGIQDAIASTYADDSHHTAYVLALKTVETAQNRLRDEMARIHSGEVAHFDFLQYEHIELIRHARALHHPPAQLDETLRAELISGAERLLSASNQLEWLIADFLRAEAMLAVMNTHLLHPETSELEDPAGQKAYYQQTAGTMMEALQSSPITALAVELRTVYPSEL